MSYDVQIKANKITDISWAPKEFKISNEYDDKKSYVLTASIDNSVYIWALPKLNSLINEESKKVELLGNVKGLFKF